jgi:hypothetical protein
MQLPVVMPPDMEIIYQKMKDTVKQEQIKYEQLSLSSVEQCVGIVNEAINELRDYIGKVPFNGQKEEILFFKEIKPCFYCQLIYYLEIYQIIINRPFGTGSIQERYLRKEQLKLTNYFENNREFYHYYRSGATQFDSSYFIAGNRPFQLSSYSIYSDKDVRFSSSHDYKVAKILANEMLGVYLHDSLRKIKDEASLNPNLNSNRKTLTWTAPKAALIEIIYSLQAYGAFNNGASGIKDVANYLQEVFQVELGNYYNCFQEIRLRKKSRTVFLDQLTEKLIQRMDEADER